ncbi:FHA domain-containing protein [Bacillus toyonensis]|uniref:FHA domain-containing protein n=1 Tax=Bacillus toyonensis TaxID=155322 RepID=UPI000BF97CFB|nr:FHA domain-containing protein [Bacillus toyonensis]PGF05281.1 hypothetical protein COM61_02395 [Bacillus toyonensis]
MGFVKLLTQDNEWVIVNELEKKEKAREDLATYLKSENVDCIVPFEIEKVKRKTFIRAKLTGKYSVLTRLQSPIDSREFVLLLKGIVDSMQTISSHNISPDYLDLDLDFIFINKESGKIELTLWVLDNLAPKQNILHMFYQMGEIAKPKSSKDKTFLEGYAKMFQKEDMGLDKLDMFVNKTYSMLEQSVESSERAKANLAKQEVEVEETPIEEPIVEEPIIEEPVVQEKVIDEPDLETPLIQEDDVEEVIIEEVKEPVVEAREEVASSLEIEESIQESDDDEILMPTDKTTFLMDDVEDEQEEEFDSGKTTILDEDEEEQIPYLIRESDGERYELSILKTETTFGKLGTDIQIKGNGLISRKHAVFHFEYGVVELEDIGSANGTHVNKKKLIKGRREQLADGDIIKFANEEFQFFEG